MEKFSPTDVIQSFGNCFCDIALLAGGITQESKYYEKLFLGTS